MKTNELRLGNYISVDCIIFKEELKVTEVCHDGVFANTKYPSEIVFVKKEDIEPIELTEEVLVKIGFEDRKEYFNYGRVFGDDGDYCDSIYIYYCPRLNHFKFTHNIVEELDLQTMDLYNIKYLHQLQNAYYLLTNEEMEVEL